MPFYGGYVGYRVLKLPTFITCQPGYTDPLLPPSGPQQIATTLSGCSTIQQNTISGYNFVTQYNNRNGTIKIPQGYVVVQRVRYDYFLKVPCSTPPKPKKGEHIEYFKTVQNSNVASNESAALDNHLYVTCCKAHVYPGQGHFTELDVAIVPFNTNWPAIPSGENAAVIPFNANQLQNFVNNILNPNITLHMWWDYVYDNCKTPPNLPGCGTNNRHDFNFFAETRDPLQNNAQTWSTGPTRFCG